MSKVIIAYTFAGLCLFGALFAAFAIGGLGKLPERVRDAEASASNETTLSAATPLPSEFIPPTLEAGRTYRISHDTPIYSEPSQAAPKTETLPAGGYFKAVYTLETPPGPWTQVTVNDGKTEYVMYLLGADLRWKVLTPVYSGEESKAQQQEAIMDMLREAGLRRRARIVVEEEPPPPPEPQTIQEWWAEEAEQMGGVTVANLVVAGAAAGATTLLTIGSIAVLSLLRRQNSWSRPVIHNSGEVIDLEAEEDPFTYSRGGKVPDILDEDEDHPRA